jgi:hypothetical protein
LKLSKIRVAFLFCLAINLVLSFFLARANSIFAFVVYCITFALVIVFMLLEPKALTISSEEQPIKGESKEPILETEKECQTTKEPKARYD